jgi:hypothetical protein
MEVTYNCLVHDYLGRTCLGWRCLIGREIALARSFLFFLMLLKYVIPTSFSFQLLDKQVISRRDLIMLVVFNVCNVLDV